MSLAYKELENIPMMQRFKLNDLFSHGENESNMSYCDYLDSDLLYKHLEQGLLHQNCVLISQLKYKGLGLWCLMPLSTVF
jgi:hypothetical protein